MTDATQYLNDLDAQLARAGIRGARRKRIVTEFADHLSCDPDAALGDPTALATQFADELGTTFARTAAYQAFVALALAGILVVVRAVALLPLTANDLGTADTVSLLISAIAAQVGGRVTAEVVGELGDDPFPAGAADTGASQLRVEVVQILRGIGHASTASTVEANSRHRRRRMPSSRSPLAVSR